ncbi:MAG: hypothetical protein M3Z29_05020 [Pseudomonadota bacterium]|nr:hypothetical protein [Pseudomonadota bacterium]
MIGALVVLLGQPFAVQAQASAPASHPPGVQPAGLGTGTEPPSAGMAIPEPATKSPSDAGAAASGQPLNDARANFAPGDPPG